MKPTFTGRWLCAGCPSTWKVRINPKLRYDGKLNKMIEVVVGNQFDINGFSDKLICHNEIVLETLFATS